MRFNVINLIDVWNKDTEDRVIHYLPSSYAVEKERLFPENSNICDLGGGSGSDSLYFASKGHKVTLIDISDVALDRARKKSEELGLKSSIDFIQCDISNGDLPLIDSSFDIIYSRMALHYFRSETLTHIFREIYRSLRAGGRAYITLKSPDDITEIQYLMRSAEEIGNGEFNDNGLIKTRYSIKNLEKIVQITNCNFTKTSISKYIEYINLATNKTRSGAEKLVLNEIHLKK